MNRFAPTHGLLAFATLLLALGCGAQEEPDAQDPHAGHAAAPAGLPEDLARRLGVTFAEAREGPLLRELRATGEVVLDETRLSTVSLRFGGWAEALHVDFTGRAVTEGEPLLEVYSPELLSAQEDLVSAARLSRELATSRVPGGADRGEALLRAARERLRLWGVSPEDIRRVEESGEIRETLTLPATSGGYVVEKNVQAGERFEAGAPLYRLADLSRVWLEVDVYERDLRFVRVGQEMTATFAAFPGEAFSGRVTFVWPEVDGERRTARVRLELPNPGARLKPGMYGTASAELAIADAAMTVPRDAVMHTGERSVVFVADDGGLVMREVQVGVEAGGRTEILSGLTAGERVVARSGFILDAESRLMEAMMGQPGMPGMDPHEGSEADVDHDDHDDHEAEADHDDHTDRHPEAPDA
jgi:membrane fusion protein, copper/silver efflux system